MLFFSLKQPFAHPVYFICKLPVAGTLPCSGIAKLFKGSPSTSEPFVLMQHIYYIIISIPTWLILTLHVLSILTFTYVGTFLLIR